MMYQNPIYGIINENTVRLQLQMQQSQAQQYHNDQLQKTGDCARKLGEFLRSMDEVDQQYQQLAFEQCCIVVGQYFQEKNSL